MFGTLSCDSPLPWASPMVFSFTDTGSDDYKILSDCASGNNCKVNFLQLSDLMSGAILNIIDLEFAEDPL